MKRYFVLMPHREIEVLLWPESTSEAIMKEALDRIEAATKQLGYTSTLFTMHAILEWLRLWN